MKTLLTILPLALIFGSATALERLQGEAYDLDSGELLYHEHHEFQYEEGELAGATVEYRRPDGEVIGRKTLDYRPSLFVPAFRTELYGGDYVEGLRYEDDDIVVFRKKGADDELKSKTLTVKGARAADAGFNNYVYERFDELMTGDEVSFKFIAAGRLTAVKFDAQRIGERTLGTTPVVDFKVEISSFFSLFVDPLKLSYDPESKYLIEYRGLSNIRDAEGELYKVRIRYPQLMRTSEEAARTPQ